MKSNIGDFGQNCILFYLALYLNDNFITVMFYPLEDIAKKTDLWGARGRGMLGELSKYGDS